MYIHVFRTNVERKHHLRVSFSFFIFHQTNLTRLEAPMRRSNRRPFHSERGLHDAIGIYPVFSSSWVKSSGENPSHLSSVRLGHRRNTAPARAAPPTRRLCSSRRRAAASWPTQHAPTPCLPRSWRHSRTQAGLHQAKAQRGRASKRRRRFCLFRRRGASWLDTADLRPP